MNTRTLIVYGLARGATERWQEDLLAGNCRTMADVEKVTAAASRDGFHSFRIAQWNGEAPDFSKAVQS